MTRRTCKARALLAILAVSGCASASSPVTGYLYSDVRVPHSATSAETYSKHGTAEATSILGLFASGDASIETAAKNAGISRIHHVDHEIYQFLGIYARLRTHVYGD